MRLVIVIPYPEAEKMTAIWAEEEKEIDFRKEKLKAERCTTAFAAMELKRYLERTLLDVEVYFSSVNPESQDFIELKIKDGDYDGEGFKIIPIDRGVSIIGDSRAGLLYGAYEFLRLQGWRWYSPGKSGEIAPLLADKLVIPEKIIECRPSMELGRGFDFESSSMESAELFLWMARNRLNLATYRPATGTFCSKLGMSFKMGGHIFERILNPDRVMPSGRTLWEEYEEWFGLPENGERIKEKAQKVQFCVSQKELLGFLGDELIRYLDGPWKEADRIDVWGFDTWGNVCSCDKCKKLGNGSDQTLYFLSKIRSRVDRAIRGVELSHNVKLVMCIYEGTSTIQGPVNPIPDNLIAAGDYGVFYPINRCYAHDFSDEYCMHNSYYRKALDGWFGHSPHLPVMIGEYYNVSKFEDLPLLFTERISRDIPFYLSTGARGITYMHIPMVNWGMRTLTQSIYSQMAWDKDTNTAAFIDEYFYNWYGPYAEFMHKAYNLIEEAWLEIAEWRAWSGRSILSQLLLWDGKKPIKPLSTGDHLGTFDNVSDSGKKSLGLMHQAMQMIDAARKESKYLPRNTDNTAVSVNPIEARKMEQINNYEMRLGEDRRLLLYGIDTMQIMTGLVEYYNALYQGYDMKSDEIWFEIEETADKLDSYYIPIGYEWPGPGLESKDALTRTQVRDILDRCRKNRL